jgi:hypothetical protein
MSSRRQLRDRHSAGMGTPEAIAANPDSHTGRYLQRLLA